MASKKRKKSQVIRAAGGLVWRQAGGGRQIAVIHRPRYDDWTLPKGKLRKGETWEAAALREVAEEINCQARLGEFAGCSCYEFEGRPKVVLYWHMAVVRQDEFQPDEEVDALDWLSPEAARERLSYGGERELLEERDDEME
jgi:8-oxo-dGTP diphosphatase